MVDDILTITEKNVLKSKKQNLKPKNNIIHEKKESTKITDIQWFGFTPVISDLMNAVMIILYGNYNLENCGVEWALLSTFEHFCVVFRRNLEKNGI